MGGGPGNAECMAGGADENVTLGPLKSPVMTQSVQEKTNLDSMDMILTAPACCRMPAVGIY